MFDATLHVVTRGEARTGTTSHRLHGASWMRWRAEKEPTAERHAPAEQHHRACPVGPRSWHQLEDAALARGRGEMLGQACRRISMCQERVLITPTKCGCGRVKALAGLMTWISRHVTNGPRGCYITVTQLSDSRTRPFDASSSLQHTRAPKGTAYDWPPWCHSPWRNDHSLARPHLGPAGRRKDGAAAAAGSWGKFLTLD
jgi:hypothetical protein